MDKFDIRSAKLLSIIGLILFIFIMVIANAYKYLPSETTDIPEVNSEISQPADDNNVENNFSEETDNTVEETTSDNQPEETVSKEEYTPLENIDSETKNVSEAESSFSNVMENAKQFKEDKQLVKAIEEYQKAITLAENSKQKAECYEEISTIYAITKKYGTALSFAQKAYNLCPSTSREILLARLYYKTGSTDKASDRINNVLRRDFNQDN